MKRILVVRPEQCLGCRSCELACALEHSASKTLLEAMQETPAPKNRLWVTKDENGVTPVQCRQCENAPCVKVCPTNALSRDGLDSPVVLDSELCTGCHDCVMACPFKAIRIDSGSGAVIKCDLCAERLAAGEKPACVSSCPTLVLELVDAERVTYEIIPEACVGCRACARKCPVNVISGEKKKPHAIDQDGCIKCGACLNACRFDAVKVECSR